MHSPKVSIVIPVCNVERYLRICIESALAQTLEDIEVIIMDDGSTDSSPRIADYYARCDSRVRVVHKENEGYGKSCNRGINMAQGEFIAILESDDYVDPSMYEELYEYATALGADVVKGPHRHIYTDGTSKPYTYVDYLTECMPHNKLYSLEDCPCQLATHQSIWAGIYRRSYLNSNNIRFVEAPGASNVDVGFCVDSLAHTNRLAWLNKIFYNYRVFRDGSSSARYSIPTNITRYKEVHDTYRSTELWQIIAPYMVAREGVGLYRYFKTAAYRDEDVQTMHDMLQDFSVDDIKRAPIIDEAMRKEMLLLREDASKSKKLIVRKRTATTGSNTLGNCLAMLHLFVRKLDQEGLYRVCVVALLSMLVLKSLGLPFALELCLLIPLGIVAFVAFIMLLLRYHKKAL